MHPKRTWNRRGASLLGSILLASLVVALPGSAQGASSPNAAASISKVTSHRFDSGEPGGLGYKARYDVQAPIAPGEDLPTIRVDADEHPDAFDGQWADAGFHAAWIAPHGEFQYFPNAYTVESGYLDAYLRSDGAPLTPGDSVEFAVKQLAGDAPLTWDAKRGEATGEMRWEVAQQEHTIHATYGGNSSNADVVFVRADLVARDGDFDARDGSVTLPPLVIDLPRSYGPEVRGSAAVSQFAPYLHYISGIEGTVLPQSGQAVFTARTRGYIPEAREHTLPGGAHIREWHIPLNIVITMTGTDGSVGARSANALPSGGRVTVIDGPVGRNLDVPAGSTVLTGAGLAPEILGGGRADALDDGAEVPGGGSGTLMDDIRATASIDHTLGEPVDVEVAKRSYGFTVDPDLHGSGTLGVRSMAHLRSGQGYFDALGFPFATVNGETIALDRSRLVELRAVPLLDWIRLGFAARSDGNALVDPSAYVRHREGRIHDPGIVVEAVYELEDDLYGFLTMFGAPGAAPSDSIQTSMVIRSLSGLPVNASSVAYVELAEPGPVTYDGVLQTHEFSGPSRALSAGAARIGAGATGGSSMTVVAASGALTPQPVADPAGSIDGVPVAVYVTSPEASGAGHITATSATLPDVSAAAVTEPGPIDAPCIEPPVVDEGNGDAPATLDIERAWFEFDGANLYSTIEVARLDENSIGSPASYRSSWRFEHIGFGFEAARDATGAWSFDLGLHSSAGASWHAINEASGEVVYGAPGYIRMSHPVAVDFADPGFLDGELLRDTGATSFDPNGVADRAPAGATDAAFGRGDDYVVALCPGVSVATVLSLTDDSATSGQYSDVARIAARLTDAGGTALAGETVNFELGGIAGDIVTDSDGVALFDPVFDLEPGTYPLTIAFNGAERLEPTSLETTFVVAREDSALSLTVEGSGANRILTASLVDADASDSRIAGRRVEFFADGVSLGSADTDADGVARLQAPPRYRGGAHDYEARFDGDPFYLGSSGRN